ncbi:hypothetical protein BDZ45DRAFT_669026 [Acephala macrosclerotiorum]|nr:hypothetical protein BDZ45DRAFT_669026 [Acephala macrosclerotiorum]
MVSREKLPPLPSLFAGGEAQKTQAQGYKTTPPKLDRTLTDVYADEPDNPSFQLSSSIAPTTTPTLPQPDANDLLAQRLQAENHQHLSKRSTTNVKTRGRDGQGY